MKTDTTYRGNYLDWDNLDVLIGPKRRNRDPFDRERLNRAKVKRCCGHKKGKNHGTGKEAAAVRRKRKSRQMKSAEQRDKMLAEWQEIARAYWAGERDDLPNP